MKFITASIEQKQKELSEVESKINWYERTFSEELERKNSVTEYSDALKNPTPGLKSNNLFSSFFRENLTRFD